MRGTRVGRKATGLIGIAAAAALALSACAAGGSTPSTAELSEDPVTLRFTWWGNDVRTAATEDVIAAFEAEYPNITIQPQFTDFGGYWDKLATETAANDSPDIIQMDEKYISTYGGRGALLDLNELGDAIDLSEFPDSAISTGTMDGALYGIPVGLTSYSMMANPVLLAAAGVAMPDDESWTWDDLSEAGAAVSASGGGNVFGVQSWGFSDGDLKNFARQHGEDLYNDEGEVSVSVETLTEWWTYLEGMTTSGVTPPPSSTVEKQNAGLAESFTATNTAAFGPWWNSQLTALTDASGTPMELLRIPTTADAEEGSAYYKPSMYWSVSSRTEYPAEAALFLDYMLNTEEAADLLGTDRGVSANEKIRAYIEPNLSVTDKAVVAFLDDLADVVGDAPALTPPGGSAVDSLLKQYTEQVLFGQATPAQAAEGFIKDLSASIAAA